MENDRGTRPPSCQILLYGQIKDGFRWTYWHAVYRPRAHYSVGLPHGGLMQVCFLKHPGELPKCPCCIPETGQTTPNPTLNPKMGQRLGIFQILWHCWGLPTGGSVNKWHEGRCNIRNGTERWKGTIPLNITVKRINYTVPTNDRKQKWSV